MSMILPSDPLMRLLYDPALLAALLAGEDQTIAAALVAPEVAAPVAAATATASAGEAAPVASPAPEADPPFTPVPEDAFPTIAELDALLADSYLPEPGLDMALRIELAEAFGIDPALIDDEQAFLDALATLEPPPEDDLPEQVSGEPSWDDLWNEPVREDWALG